MVIVDALKQSAGKPVLFTLSCSRSAVTKPVTTGFGYNKDFAPGFSHRAYILKKKCDLALRTEPPLGVGGVSGILKYLSIDLRIS